MIKILHVDDDHDQLEIMRYQLERISEDLQVTSTDSGSQALDILDKEQFDCIISDYQMPGMDGLELLKSLKNNQIGTPTIMVSAQCREEIVAKAQQTGAFDFLQKDWGIAHYKRIITSIKKAVA